MYNPNEPVQLYTTALYPDDELGHGHPVEVYPLIVDRPAPREIRLYLNRIDPRCALVFRDSRDEESIDYASPEDIEAKHKDRDTDYAIDLDTELLEVYSRGGSVWMWVEPNQPLRLVTTKEMSAAGMREAIYYHPQFMSAQAHYTWKRENRPCRTTNDQLRRRAQTIRELTTSLTAALPFNKSEQILHYTASLVKASAVLNALAQHFATTA